MKQYRNLPDLLSADPVIRLYISKVMGKDTHPFEEYLGGDIFEIETEKDIDEIPLNLVRAEADSGGTSIDIAEWADKARTYAFFFLATNDAGGPGYFVPSRLVNTKLLDTIALTNDWIKKMRIENAK